MKLYNTMSRSIEDIEPLEPGKIRMYTCGLTVYSQPQIGNWVAYIYSDVLTRALLANGYDVTRIQNITDVGHLVSDDDSGEDKMEKGARAEGLTAWDVAKKYTAIAEHEAYEMLGLLRPNKLVPATSLIDKQIAFAKLLYEKGFLYRINDGLYFDTSTLRDYGKLARLDITGLQAGARVDMAGKQHPTDFAVWKFSPVGQKRDMEWDSPWGKGFPGWHLECSVIARENLGDQLDIHTGGIDHIPVHHTNEIAQTEAVTAAEFVKYWFHNNHMKVNGTKLSKSLGNSYTLSDLIEKGYSLDAFKLLVLSSHYRTEGNFTWEILSSAENRLTHWRSVAALRHQSHNAELSENTPLHTDRIVRGLRELRDALANDLDTSAALASIDAAFGYFEKLDPKAIPQEKFVAYIEAIDTQLGLHIHASTPDISDHQKRLIVDREQARQSQDWAKSDSLRDTLLAEGISVRDTSRGTVWSYTEKS
jgi:cysteinyl-tRNA synthetase